MVVMIMDNASQLSSNRDPHRSGGRSERVLMLVRSTRQDILLTPGAVFLPVPVPSTTVIYKPDP
jgi:hypothetical protein